MKHKSLILKLIPIFFVFYVMGFCDIVGVSVTYAKEEFNWSEIQAGFLPSMVFLWFLILSIPTAVFMGRIGRKNTVLLSIAFTFIGMLIPFFRFDIITCYIAFALLGIGNAILQVSLNPLLSNIVENKQLTSSLTAGQFIKSISAFLGPILVSFCSLYFNNWALIFLLYSVIALLSGIFLYFSPISREPVSVEGFTYGTTFELFKNKQIVILFIGILCIVGLDVGMNISVPKLLMERVGLGKEAAGYGTSWYFAARTIGTFIGMFLLTKIAEVKYFRLNMIIALIALAVLIFVQTQSSILCMVVVIAFTCSCVFSIIYSMALQIAPDRKNEISGLLITGVAGGAIFPPLMGICSDFMGSQMGAILVIGFCAFYLFFCAFKIKPLG